MSNKHCDETGYNWQNYGENGSKKILKLMMGFILGTTVKQE